MTNFLRLGAFSRAARLPAFTKRSDAIIAHRRGSFLRISTVKTTKGTELLFV